MVKIVFIPGGAVSPDASLKVLAEYSKVLKTKIDLLTYPEFVKKDFNINLDNYVDYFKEEVRKINNRKLIIIGYSLGAYFALNLASIKNIPLKAVVLVSPFIKRPKNFLETFWNRTMSNIHYENEGKLFAYPFYKIVLDMFTHGRMFISQYMKVISRLDLTDKMLNSDTRKILIMGNRDNVIPKLTERETAMKNSRIFYLKGNHDIITNQHLEVGEIISKLLYKS